MPTDHEAHSQAQQRQLRRVATTELRWDRDLETRGCSGVFGLRTCLSPRQNLGGGTSPTGHRGAQVPRRLMRVFCRFRSMSEEFDTAHSMSACRCLRNLNGPSRTAHKLTLFFRENGGNPRSRTAKFLRVARVHHENLTLMEDREADITHDQLDISALASFKHLCRLVQFLEEAYRSECQRAGKTWCRGGPDPH